MKKSLRMLGVVLLLALIGAAIFGIVVVQRKGTVRVTPIGVTPTKAVTLTPTAAITPTSVTPTATATPITGQPASSCGYAQIVAVYPLGRLASLQVSQASSCNAITVTVTALQDDVTVTLTVTALQGGGGCKLSATLQQGDALTSCLAEQGNSKIVVTATSGITNVTRNIYP